MRAVSSAVLVLALGLGLAGCGRSETESSLTQAQVERKLTAAPSAGLKKLTSASCKPQDRKNEYRCDVVTEDGDSAILLVRADGDEVLVDSARTN